MARPKGKSEVVPRRKAADEFSDPLQLTDEVLDRCIEVYLSTGNWAAVGRAVGRSRSWALQLFRSPRCVERMKQKSLEVRGNSNIANIEECMQKLTSIMRGEQIKELSESVRNIVEGGGSSIQIEDAIDRIARFAPGPTPPTKSAGPVLRAGFTEVLVMGIEMRWIRVRARPMAIPANPAGARRSVEPRMTRRNI